MKELAIKIKNCKKCDLWETRNLPTIYSGNLKSKIMFIGEAPGRNEDETGMPFCGRAGQILDELLEYVNLKREDIFITNILKCRPPSNRDPKEEEINECKVYLEEQIRILKPKIICPLGRFSSRYMLKKNLEMGDMHGKIFKINNIFIIPMYHPAAVIYDNKKREMLKKDFKKLIKIYDSN